MSNPLFNFIARGICLIPMEIEYGIDRKVNKKAKWRWKTIEDRKKFIDDLPGLRSHKKKYSLFAFVPMDYNFLILDIDRKNGIDGLINFKRFLVKEKIVLPWMPGIEKHPYYVKTPSDGYHLYFTYNGESIISSSHFANEVEGVEVKYKSLVIAPDSRTEKKYYKPHGNFDDIREFPYVLKKYLVLRNKSIESKPYKHYFTNDFDYKDCQLSLDKITEILYNQGHNPGGGRHNFCFEFGKFALKKGHSKKDILNYLEFLIPGFNDNGEIKSCINSIIK